MIRDFRKRTVFDQSSSHNSLYYIILKNCGNQEHSLAFKDLTGKYIKNEKRICDLSNVNRYMEHLRTGFTT